MGEKANYDAFYSSKTCKICKGLIRKPSAYGYCERCDTSMDEVYRSVREYLQDNPSKTPFDIQKELGISIKIVNHLIEEGRVHVK
ncbi:MAG: hypothetical protein ACOYVK_19570 [Bacillota bacterium]